MQWAFLVDSVPFTQAVRDGQTSLGGSESACVGLARALAARGHRVQIYATKLEPGAEGADAHGVDWWPMSMLGNACHVEYDVVVALRMWQWLSVRHIPARFRVLWCQDMLMPGQGGAVMGSLWAADALAYVSAYHRAQWEGVEPHLAPYGWATRNGFDPAHVPTDITKDWRRIIHVSRPERGLRPLLAMWPALKAQVPEAELRLCRYSSMYDAGGWGKVCDAYDAQVQQVNAEVGGITYLGELAKPALYREIASAAVMWYPGVKDFAETSCIAAIEAQACGTPFIGSWKGALPETVPSGVLLGGDAMSPEYQAESVARVVETLQDCRRQARRYREWQDAGRAHVTPRYTYAALAEEWEGWVLEQFRTRYEANTRAVLERLLLWDDHTAARQVALDLDDTAAIDFCDMVIAGRHQTAEDYGEHALKDPIAEGETDGRLQAAREAMAGCQHVLDVACGNGAWALAYAVANPTARVVGVDYSAANIEKARTAADTLGISDRVTFHQQVVYDYDTQAMATSFSLWLAGTAYFDGIFCGEFLEHVANTTALIDGLEAACAEGARVCYTTPHGPFSLLLPRGKPLKRGHVHAFEWDDMARIFGRKASARWDALHLGTHTRGPEMGVWLVTYTVQRDGVDRRAQPRDYFHRIRATRPHRSLSVGILAKNAETDLARCLSSVWNIADEIVIGDTGSTDTTLEIAAAYGAKVLHLPDVQDTPDGFAGARNAVLQAATGHWFLWIDTDEWLVQPGALGKYLETGPFQGYALNQQHLYIDMPPTADTPIRLFRRRPEIAFYGCVHEQPQWGDANGEIMPALHLSEREVIIAHLGYLTEGVRRVKRVRRNAALLQRDQERFPTRALGKLLWVREAVLEGDDERAKADGRMTDVAARWYGLAIALFEEHFSEPGSKFYALARPFYSQAVQHTASGMEFAYGMAGAQGGMQGRTPQLKTLWVRPERFALDYERLIAYELAEMQKGLAPRMPDVEPVVARSREVAA